MIQVSMRQFRALKWDKSFDELGVKVFTTGEMHGFAVVHHEKNGRTQISYRTAGRSFSSPSEAVGVWNRQHVQGRLGAAGSPQSIAARKIAVCGRGDVRP